VNPTLIALSNARTIDPFSIAPIAARDKPAQMNRRQLGTMSPTGSMPTAKGASASPAAKFCTPFPIHSPPFGESRLNKIVPPTSDRSE